LDRFTRQEALERLAGGHFELLVIGGGITGAGVLLDAATRGLSAALIEARDFGSGTSSRSSKLVHGGLRYLAQHDYLLVYEALAERERLRRIAPHMVSLIEFVLPVLSRKARPSLRTRYLYATALWLYDLTGGFRSGRIHRKLNPRTARLRVPVLPSQYTKYAYLYYDARTDDARLCLEVIKTACLCYGAVAANWVECVGFLKDARGRAVGVAARTREGEEFEIRADAIVNATGVFADAVASLDEASSAPELTPAKGVHLSFSADALPAQSACVLPVPGDSRTIFVIPWGPVTYVGTTDTPYSGDMVHPQVAAEDVSYLLDAINLVTTAKLGPGDVLSAWAGLRPLVGHADPGVRTADLSRRHRIDVSRSGVVTVTGGKLTTYRLMAEQAVDAALSGMGISNLPSRTKSTKLIGARGNYSQAPPHLRERYGWLYVELEKLMAEDPSLADPLAEGYPYLKAELAYAFSDEMALTLDDALSRRLRLSFLDVAAARAAAPLAAQMVASGPSASTAGTQYPDALLEEFARECSCVLPAETAGITGEGKGSKENRDRENEESVAAPASQARQHRAH
jgi:glycerol-3-phosphate dehydrogenase